jgi:23S rRNA pseudouridine1911/1915/1917 synthase
MTADRILGEAGRLDAVVARITGVSRADVQRSIAAGRVRVNGAIRPKSYLLTGGERIDVELDPTRALAAEGPPVPVRFEDGDLLIVAKPAGIVTHPTDRRRTGTLVNRLIGMGVPLSTIGGSLRPGIVHRLDAGTSGLMIVAKTDPAHEALAAMFKGHEVDRRYLALVRGTVDHDVFAVDAALGRQAARIVVDQMGGRPAQTRFEVRERFDAATVLEATPRTGRTHQIRVHLSAIGHPIVGDRAYGGVGDLSRQIGLDRPFLHSWHIAFRHPITGERIERDVGLPSDLARGLGRLRGRDDASQGAAEHGPDLRP